MRSRRWAWLLVVACSVAAAMTQSPAPLPPTGDVAVDLYRALQYARPAFWQRVGQVPAAIRERLATVPPNSPDLPMADVGEAYNATDMRAGNLPNARFVFGGRDATVGFVVSQLGGFVPSQHLHVYSLRGDRIVASCVYELRRWARDWGTLLSILASGPGKVVGPCGAVAMPIMK